MSTHSLPKAARREWSRPGAVRSGALRRQELSPMPQNAFGVRPLEGETGEELCGHAAASAGVELRARGAGADAPRLATQPCEKRRLSPNPLEASVVNVASQEGIVDSERASVDVAYWVYQAHDPTSSAQVEARQPFAECREVEERVPRQHLVTVSDKPRVERPLLLGSQVQLLPHVCSPAGWS